jgi:hypothetical protein
VRSTILALFFAIPSLATAQIQHTIAGQWSNYLNIGIGGSADGQCVYRQLEERRYVIQPAPGGGFEGTYANTVHTRWLRRSREDCALANLKPEQLYIQLRTWTLRIQQITTQKYMVDAVFSKCWGLPCDGSTKRGNFATSLEVVGGELFDAAKDAADLPPLTFRPLTANVERATSAATRFMTSWWAALRKTNGPAEGVGMIDPITIGDNEWARTNVRDYIAARMEKSVRFVVLEAYILPGGDDTIKSPPILHFSVRNYQTTGENIGETYELVQRDGHWRLVGFRF